MRRDIVGSVVAIVVLTIGFGLVYPLAMTGVAQVAFKDQANGSVYLSTGPGGDLYYVDMDLGRIGRFTFNSNNAAPTARIVETNRTAPPASTSAPMSVSATGSMSEPHVACSPSTTVSGPSCWPAR